MESFEPSDNNEITFVEQNSMSNMEEAEDLSFATHANRTGNSNPPLSQSPEDSFVDVVSVDSENYHSNWDWNQYHPEQISSFWQKYYYNYWYLVFLQEYQAFITQFYLNHFPQPVSASYFPQTSSETVEPIVEPSEDSTEPRPKRKKKPKVASQETFQAILSARPPQIPRVTRAANASRNLTGGDGGDVIVVEAFLNPSQPVRGLQAADSPLQASSLDTTGFECSAGVQSLPGASAVVTVSNTDQTKQEVRKRRVRLVKAKEKSEKVVEPESKDSH